MSGFTVYLLEKKIYKEQGARFTSETGTRVTFT